MLKLSELKEGSIYKADKAPGSWFFSVVNGNLHSDQGRAEGNLAHAKIEIAKQSAKEAGRKSTVGTDSFVFGPCTYVPMDATFTLIEEVFTGEGITQGAAVMKEGQVYSVKLLTGKKITVDEVVTGKVVTLQGKTYRLGKIQPDGTRKLRLLKSKISLESSPVAIA